MPCDPLRWSQFAGRALLLAAAACLAAIAVDSKLRPCPPCARNAAYAQALSADQMSWVPSGRPLRYPLLETDLRLDPNLPLASPDPADILFLRPLISETTHEAQD